MLPRTRRAYETPLERWLDCGALTRNCTELIRLPSERIADNALRANWSARDDLHVQGCLILSQVGLLFPVNHAPKIGVPDRLRAGDLLRERQACWLDYTFFRSPQTRKPHDSSQAALSDLRMNAAEKVCHT